MYTLYLDIKCVIYDRFLGGNTFLLNYFAYRNSYNT